MDRMYHALQPRSRMRMSRRRSSFFSAGMEILEDRIAPAGNLQSLLGLNQIQTAFPAANGSGYTVALLDTGINYNLPSLGGGIGPGYRVVYGYNFVNNTTNALDDNGHGTFLANMIGSSNPSDLGIAPKVQFADLKVLDANMNGPWSAVDNALQWVIANKTTYNIVAVNLSLGGGNYTSDQFDSLENDLANLKSMGVFIAAASGNNFAGGNSQAGLSYPAVDPDVVSVGATWAGSYGAQTFNGATDNSTAPHQFADFTQRDSALDILAPGAWITTIGMTGSETTLGGTSMATAVITGAAVLLHQVLDQTGQSAFATEQGILQLMQSTGTAVVDNSTNTNVKPTGLTFEEINLMAALTAAAPPGAPTLAPIAGQSMLVGQTIAVKLPITHAANDPVTFSTQVIDLAALAFQLDQQYGLTSSGNYYTDEFGYNEKWLTNSKGTWFWLMPDGDLRLYAGYPTATLQPANLLGTLNASYYANPALLWNAPVASNPTTTLSVSNNTLSIASTVYWIGAYAIAVTATDGQHNPVTETFNVTVNPAPPTLTAIANQTVTSVNRILTLPLSATEPGGGPVTYSAQVLPTNGQTPPVTVSLNGNQLTLNPASTFIGTYTVQVNASDLGAVSSRTFTVTVTNGTATLGAVAAQTMNAGQTSLANALPVTNLANDPLTFQAVTQTPNASAYLLNQQYAFQPSNATYNFNLTGNNEKWLIGKNNQWYALLPNGNLYRWVGTIAQTLTAANLVATLAPSIYTEPRLLWNANPPVTPALTFSFQGNQLTIHRPATLTGVFFITVTLTDGSLITQSTFEVTLN